MSHAASISISTSVQSVQTIDIAEASAITAKPTHALIPAPDLIETLASPVATPIGDVDTAAPVVVVAPGLLDPDSAPPAVTTLVTVGLPAAPLPLPPGTVTSVTIVVGAPFAHTAVPETEKVVPSMTAPEGPAMTVVPPMTSGWTMELPPGDIVGMPAVADALLSPLPAGTVTDAKPDAPSLPVTNVGTEVVEGAPSFPDPGAGDELGPSSLSETGAGIEGGGPKRGVLNVGTSRLLCEIAIAGDA